MLVPNVKLHNGLDTPKEEHTLVFLEYILHMSKTFLSKYSHLSIVFMISRGSSSTHHPRYRTRAPFPFTCGFQPFPTFEIILLSTPSIQYSLGIFHLSKHQRDEDYTNVVVFRPCSLTNYNCVQLYERNFPFL